MLKSCSSSIMHLRCLAVSPPDSGWDSTDIHWHRHSALYFGNEGCLCFPASSALTLDYFWLWPKSHFWHSGFIWQWMQHLSVSACFLIYMFSNNSTTVGFTTCSYCKLEILTYKVDLIVLCLLCLCQSFLTHYCTVSSQIRMNHSLSICDRFPKVYLNLC